MSNLFVVILRKWVVKLLIIEKMVNTQQFSKIVNVLILNKSWYKPKFNKKKKKKTKKKKKIIIQKRKMNFSNKKNKKKLSH